MREIMQYILVIENDMDNCEFIKKTLSQEYEVIVQTSEKDAISDLEHRAPNLLLLAYSAAEGKGINLLQYIKAKDELKEIPVIFLVESEMEELERDYIGSGAYDFIIKPYNKLVLEARVKRALELERLRKNLEGEILEKGKQIDFMKSIIQKDSLTGLWNRAYTEEHINEYLKDPAHSGVLFMIDMDNFKVINDTHGHIVGDETLVEFADTLQSLIRQNDIVCRLGGDEFIVFLKDLSSYSIISEKAEQILMALENRLKNPEIEENFSVSIGIAIAPNDGNNFTQLYKNADKSLYYVKQNGKNAYHFYSEEESGELQLLKRRALQLDFEHLRKFIEEVGYAKGAYQVEYEGFKKIYRFVARYIARTGQYVQTVLFTLKDQEENVPQLDALLLAMENLKTAVNDSIRRGDVATSYSNSQFIVILMDASLEDAELVAERILHTYRDLHQYRKEVKLSYDIQSIGSAPISSDFDANW